MLTCSLWCSNKLTLRFSKFRTFFSTTCRAWPSGPSPQRLASRTGAAMDFSKVAWMMVPELGSWVEEMRDADGMLLMLAMEQYTIKNVSQLTKPICWITLTTDSITQRILIRLTRMVLCSIYICQNKNSNISLPWPCLTMDHNYITALHSVLLETRIKCIFDLIRLRFSLKSKSGVKYAWKVDS